MFLYVFKANEKIEIPRNPDGRYGRRLNGCREPVSPVFLPGHDFRNDVVGVEEVALSGAMRRRSRGVVAANVRRNRVQVKVQISLGVG